MGRDFTPNRWNWSQEDEKWVFVKVDANGNKICYYQLEPPGEFHELTLRIKNLNEKLLLCKDPEENDRIFNEMVKTSKRMQCMGRLEQNQIKL